MTTGTPQLNQIKNKDERVSESATATKSKTFHEVQVLLTSETRFFRRQGYRHRNRARSRAGAKASVRDAVILPVQKERCEG